MGGEEPHTARPVQLPQLQGHPEGAARDDAGSVPFSIGDTGARCGCDRGKRGKGVNAKWGKRDQTANPDGGNRGKG